MKEPESFEETESWLGMVGWHREFIKGLSGMLVPIYKIQKEERERERNGEVR